MSLSVWKQPPPQALRFSQGRGERLVMNPRDHGKGTRQVWKFESVFLPKMSQFCRLCKLGPGSALGKKAKKKKKGLASFGDFMFSYRCCFTSFFAFFNPLLTTDCAL